MIQAYPLIIEGIPFRDHSIVGIYPFKDKVAITHFAFGYTTQEEYDKEKCTPSYAMLDTFSLDFKERCQAYLSYYEQEIFSPHDAVCYWENDVFLMNTKRHNGFSQNIAKIIQITDTNLTEIGDAPTPTPIVYCNKKTYIFGSKEVKMVSSFIMECRDAISNNVLWKLKLSAYLYTEVEEQNGVLYFGTAGKGGRFYGVRIADGSVILNYNTGGTERFIWYKGEILLADRNGKPILLNPSTGIESRKIEFGNFTFNSYQFMLVIADSLYAIAIDAKEMYAVCVNLSAT